jgi:hypothetical protein
MDILNSVMSIRVSYEVGNFMNSWAIISSSNILISWVIIGVYNADIAIPDGLVF